MKTLVLLLLTLTTGCSTTYIDARKFVIVQGAENTVIVTGSELKDNNASQEAKPNIEIPLVK